MYRGVEYSRTHLQAGEEVDVVSRVGDPHVEGLALLHDDAWWHERAAGVPQATGLALRDAVQLRQELPQRLIGVHIQRLFLPERPCSAAYPRFSNYPICSMDPRTVLSLRVDLSSGNPRSLQNT